MTSATPETAGEDVRVARPSLPPPTQDELASPPLLGYLACAAAVVDVVLNRWVLRSLNPERSHDLQMALLHWGALPRNLAALAGLVALGAALVTFVRLPGYAPIRRRLSLAAFAGIFIPTVTLATLLPREYTSVQLVFFGIGAGNVLAILAALTALRRSGPLGLRLALLFAALSCFAALNALVLGLVEQYSEIVALAVLLLRRTGEVLFLAVPIAAGATVFPHRDIGARDVLALAASGVASLVTAVAVTTGAMILREGFAVVLYGAFRFEWALDALPLVYVVPISIFVGVAAYGLISSNPAARQVGAGLLLLLCAGNAPRAPGRLLVLVLAITLLSRAAIALGTAFNRPEPKPKPKPAPAAAPPRPEPLPPAEPPPSAA